MNKYVFLILLFFLIFVVTTGTYGQNLLQDPSFESMTEITTESNPWRFLAFNNDPASTEFLIEKGEAHSGEHYVTIVNIKPNHARFIQRVDVVPGTIYRLSCWTKTESVGTEAKGANITEEGIIEISPGITGTSDGWVSTEMYLKTGEEVESIVVSISLGGYYATNTGEASFDDVSLEPVTAIPQGAIVATKGNYIEKEKKAAQDKKQPVRIVKNTEPVNGIVLIAVIIGIICAAFITGRIIFINIKKKKMPARTDKT